MSKILRIKNWQEFQHYKNRGPYWIKLHFRLLSSQDWVRSSDADRSLLIACMLIASQSKHPDGRFEADADYFRRVAYLNGLPDFKSLIQIGFLESLDVSRESLDNLPIEKRREETEKERTGPQTTRPIPSLVRDLGKSKSFTTQQTYATAGILANQAARLIASGARGAELKEDLKVWAAKSGVPYDAEIVRRALDVAEGISRKETA